MHVPYSMRDDEPDLYGSLGGRIGDDDIDSSRYAYALEFIPCTKFYTQEDMDKVIQFNIKAVRASYDEGFADGYTEGNLNCQHR